MTFNDYCKMLRDQADICQKKLEELYRLSPKDFPDPNEDMPSIEDCDHIMNMVFSIVETPKAVALRRKRL
jgi:hypothetical protein